MTGIKYDHGKALPDLVLGDFMIALEQAVFAGTFGAFKYEPKNFQKLENGEQRYAEAAFRHYMARKKGDEFDPESGELHDAHELWCHIARLYFKLREDRRVFEKAITRSDGLYHHPTLDEFGNTWQQFPFWYSTTDARKIIWALAAEQKGELDIKVEVREVTKKFQVPVFDLHFENRLEAEDFISMLESLKPDPNTFFAKHGRHKNMGEEDYDGPPLHWYNYFDDTYYIGNGAWDRDSTNAQVYDKPVPGLLEEVPGTMFAEVKHEPYVIHDEVLGFVAGISREAGVLAWSHDLSDASRFHKDCARQWIEDHPSVTISMRKYSSHDSDGNYVDPYG